jgi:hypothetical protein
MTYYHDETNSGGTFSLHELVRVFLDCEPEQVKEEIIKEVEVINKNLILKIGKWTKKYLNFVRNTEKIK